MSTGIGTIWSLDCYKDLSRLLREVQPDVVHFHNIFPLISPSAYYACKKTGARVVQTLHNYRLLCPSALLYHRSSICTDCVSRRFAWPGILRRCYRNSAPQTAAVAVMTAAHRLLRTFQNQVDTYISLTSFSQRFFIEGGLPAKKVAIKPNFVHPDPGRKRNGRHYMLYVGRLAPEKGVETLLHSFKGLPEIPLKIAGDGPLLKKMVKYIHSSNIRNVQIMGYRSGKEIIELLKSAACLIFPSLWYEGFPMSIAESFACGVPVITSRIGALEEIVDHRGTGLHFIAGNPQDLAEKIEWVWTHPANTDSMGKQARSEYENNYTAEKNYQMLMDIYDKAIGNL